MAPFDKREGSLLLYSTMVQSMTGFGSAERDNCRVEVRSINHKFLDIYFKAPQLLNQLEMPFRNILKERFARGKFDIAVSISQQAALTLTVDTVSAGKIVETFRLMQKELSIKGDIDINTLVGLRELFLETTQSYDLDIVTDVFRRALDDLYVMRTAEGRSLASEIRLLTASLLEMNEKIKSSCEGVLQGIKDKFHERVKELLEGGEIDPNRMLQEAAIFAAKLDIAEEIARIESHIKQFLEILDGGDIIGRKLDFVLQELNREVNTIASKSADYEVSRTTVDMKTAIEKIREQVQNLQ